jgi:hypothetical protein
VREGLADVQVRPASRLVYHRKRDSIEAHLTIAFAARRRSAMRWVTVPHSSLPICYL